MAATERDHQTSSSSVGLIFPDQYDNLEYGQTVTPSETYVVEQVKFYAQRHKLNPGTCYVSIEETTAGLPNGSKITDNASFECPDDKTLRTVTFSTQPTLESGTKYAILFENPSGIIGTAPWYDDGKRLQIFGYTTNGAYYTDGDLVKRTSSGWETNTSADLYFALWGSPGLPGKPTNVSPENEASDIALHSTTGTWASGGNTDSYNVYYGTLSGFLELVEEGVTDLSLALVEGNFSVYGKISYWRVDAVNDIGTTTGDEWYFTTMNFDPVLPTGITLDHSGGEGGVPTGTATGLNSMITIRRLVAAARNKIFYET